jgi:uncharacterized membrane-anchored protein
MSQPNFDQIVRAGILTGVLPESAKESADTLHPWPVIVLTALGAWLSAIPITAVFLLMFGTMLEHGIAGYMLGPLVLAGAIALMRNAGLPLFIEQLGLPMLMVGLALLGFALSRDMHLGSMTASLAGVVAVIAWLVPRSWLRFPLGAAIAVLLSLSITSFCEDSRFALNADLFAWYLVEGMWAGIVAVQWKYAADPRAAQIVTALEAVSGGIGIAVVSGLALFSGSTFLLEGLLDWHAFPTPTRPDRIMPTLSVLLTLVGAASVARKWASLRRPWYPIVVLALAALAWFSPGMGAVLAMLAVCLTSARWGLASVAALSALWIVGAFYYQLAWPLTTKALLLACSGLLLGAAAWLQKPKATGAGKAAGAATAQNGKRFALPMVAATGFLVLVAVNFAIWQKEWLIETGKPVFVELAPADPRSLMQGDFMRLNFALPGDVRDQTIGLGNAKAHVVASQDARGVASLTRLDNGTALHRGEFLIELVPKEHRLVLVTDAWFFQEGESDRWAQAKYGEFRVDEKGRAMLVGLRGERLEKL